MQLTGIRNTVFLDRYALKDEKGAPMEQTPEEMWRRVAKGIAGVEKKANRKAWEEKFYNVMEGFKFLPGGRILAGAGTGFDVTYFNCFVIPNPPDSRGGIMQNLTQMIEIMAHGGGVGLNLSGLRPRGARVKKVNGFSSGPMNWAELYSLATKDIVQQGGSRRGALMLMIHDWHPDVEEFITVKQDLNKINGANLSVCVSDDFMEAVKKDADWDLVYPDLDDPKYDKEWDGDIHGWKAKGGKVKVLKTIKASHLWDLICQAAWRSAEPGLHFLDRSNKRSNTWYFEKLLATNPCGEQPLGAWAVCNLGAMNLSAYVREDNLPQDKGGWFDYDAFAKDVQTSMRFLDNVIDDTHYFFEQNEKVAKEVRRTGLGIMGIADAFIKMKVRYGSEESIEISKKIFQTLRDNAYIASSNIAAEKGSFPKYNKEKYLQGYHIKQLPKTIRDLIAKQGIRNAVLLTIAPTGTTSFIAGVSSGVEPVYEFEYLRRTKVGEAKMYHELYDAWRLTHEGVTRPEYFVSANDLSPEDHVKIQAIAQEYIDSSISKTVNAPSTHTVEDVKKLYMLSYDMGLKGVTYMREGSRQGVLERVQPKKETSQMRAIGRQVLLMVDADMRRFARGGLIELPISINFSAAELEDRALIDALLAWQPVGGFARVLIEVTESSQLAHAGKAAETLRLMMRLGARVAVDDFGTGYSNLEALERMRPSVVKIDRSMLIGVHQHKRGRKVLAAAVQLAHALGARVVIEGVETVDQHELASELGAEEVQGNLFAEPMAADQLLVWLGAWRPGECGALLAGEGGSDK